MSTDSGIEQAQSSNIALPPLGTVIADRFRILEMVGQGGMGVVFRAEHINLQKEMAVKMLMGDFALDGNNYKRFHTEARIASMLDHPNIVRVHDFGILGNGVPYLAMDFLAGHSLDDDLKLKITLPLDRFRMIFLQTCDALEHAHQEGVVHRDIKPSNIMLVTRNKQSDFVKIVDFGLVKVCSMDGKDQKLTSTNTLVGSPLFMSPEQCRGLDLDLRSDIYSLGCVMYRALTGALPIAGATALDTLYKHVSEQPVPMSKLNPSLKVPPELECVVMKALCKTPDARQQTMAELRAELERALPGAPVHMVGSSARMPVYVPPQETTQVSQASRLRESAIMHTIPPTPAEGIKVKPSGGNSPMKLGLVAAAILFFGALAVNGLKHVSSHPVTRPAGTEAVAPAQVPPHVVALQQVHEQHATTAPAPVVKPKAAEKPVEKLGEKQKPIVTVRPDPVDPHEAAKAKAVQLEKTGTKKLLEVDYAGARADFERALQIRDDDDLLGPTSGGSMALLSKLIKVSGEQHDKAAVEKYFLRFCECWQAHPNPTIREKTDLMVNVTEAALRLGQMNIKMRHIKEAHNYMEWAGTFAQGNPTLMGLVQEQAPFFAMEMQRREAQIPQAGQPQSEQQTGQSRFESPFEEQHGRRRRRMNRNEGAILRPQRQ